jgi:hypothetical protein
VSAPSCEANGDSRRCSHCGGEFRALRRSARFCGSTCRVAAHRKSGCNANSALVSLSEIPPASQNGSNVHAGRPASTAEKLLSVTRRHGAFTIVADAAWPGMYRVKCPDGTLTEMINLARAKDALAELAS